MGEEIPTPISPEFSNIANSHASSTRRTPDTLSRDGKERVPERRRSTVRQQSAGEIASRGKGKEQNRVKVSGLNVVTNFTKAPLPTRRDPDTTLAGTQGIRYERRNVQPSEITTLSDNKGAKGSGPDERRGKGNVERTLSRKSKFQDGIKGPIGSLRCADHKITELSPSDRTLVIGISIPSTKLAEHTKSPDSPGVQPSGLAFPQKGTDDPSTFAPDIFVTPALADSPSSTTSYEKPELVEPARRRAASSIYSQATHYARAVSQLERIPPLPAPLLPSGRYVPKSTLPDNDEKQSRSRVTSYGTEFDEDESPRTEAPNRWSKESQLAILKRSSTDTIATHRRSQGWWNQVLSPFLTRTNTMTTKHSPTEDEQRPEVPELPKWPKPAQSERPSGAGDLADNPQSPLEPPGKRRSGRSSIWTDMSRLEGERRTLGLTLDRARGAYVEGLNTSSDIEDSYSPAFQEGFGFGTAAEYYEACWHDQNSPTPFFECHNHSCPQSNDLEQDVHGTGRNDEDIGKNIQPEIDVSHDVKEGAKLGNVFQQKPGNRFSAAFKEALSSRPRSHSEETIMEELDTTPQVQEAQAAPVIKSRVPVPTVQPSHVHSRGSSQEKSIASPEPTNHSSSRQPLPYSPQKPEKPTRRYVAVLPPAQAPVAAEQPMSPQAMTPTLQRAMASKDAIPMVEVPRVNQPQPIQHNYYVNRYYAHPNNGEQHGPVTSTDFEPLPNNKEEQREFKEKGERRPRGSRKSEGRSRVWKSCFSRNKLRGSNDKRKRKKKCLYIAIAGGLVAMIILIVVLAMTLTRKGDKMPIETQWLNITGYPPIPTGISTVAQPDVVKADSGCVRPTTLWSCALPKEQQSSVAANEPDQPNFRLEIRFRNGTTAPNGTTIGKRSQSGRLNAVTVGHFVGSHLRVARDGLADALYTPNPSPPSQEDQAFLGNTTDNNTAPLDGEYTPFYISFLTTNPTPSRLVRRQDRNSTNNTDAFPDLSSAIPPPDLDTDGTAAAANLLPFPSAQPLRLYNRGLANEHYGFYNYFDRSIFLKSSALLNSTDTSIGEVPDNENGGSEEDAATVRCTWAQTRFLVQIWTNLGGSGALLPRLNSAASPSPTKSSSPATATSNVTLSSANDFSRPGSFPYPVSITLDRHGGDISKKMIYCYGLDDRARVLSEEKKIQLEDREFGGVLVNPASGPFGNVNVSLSDGGPGGIDGGTGGCECSWRNWERTAG